jgi:mono/diheme cytochrome c family protein
MQTPHPAISPRPARLYGAIAGVLAMAWLLLVGAQPAGAAETVTSQCVVCHTDTAKLKALTPPDPPSTEEGEG